MSRLHLTALVLLLCAGTASPATPPAGPAVVDEAAVILKADRAFAQAAVEGNAERFASFMTEDFVLIVLEPATSTAPAYWTSTTKQQWVEGVRTQRQRYTAVELHNQVVHLQGTIATVTGSYEQTATKDGKDDSSTGSYVETWVKRGGRWLILNGVFP
jgi:ketosteroid isomerase-like protein